MVMRPEGGPDQQFPTPSPASKTDCWLTVISAHRDISISITQLVLKNQKNSFDGGCGGCYVQLFTEVDSDLVTLCGPLCGLEHEDMPWTTSVNSNKVIVRLKSDHVMQTGNMSIQFESRGSRDWSDNHRDSSDSPHHTGDLFKLVMSLLLYILVVAQPTRDVESLLF